jgi:uncharacterized membrane protein (Fun14 family)
LLAVAGPGKLIEPECRCNAMYDYQAFFSYKRHPLTDEWHRQLMLHIQFWLSQDLGTQDVPIFFDTRSIGNGAVFDHAIGDALRKSVVIISVMSPLYFTSAHCLAEIGTFIDREDHLQQNRGTLISCARFHDGAAYPMPFSHMQSEDFSPYANPAKGFWESQDGVVFELKIRAFAGMIANKIRAAPPWDPAFPPPPYSPGGTPPLARILRPAAYLGAESS